MPIEITKPCDNCGNDFPVDNEKCSNCDMYRGEDPEEFLKLSDEEQ